MRPDKDTRVSDIPMIKIQVARHETKADDMWSILDASVRLVSCSECTSWPSFVGGVAKEMKCMRPGYSSLAASVRFTPRFLQSAQK